MKTERTYLVEYRRSGRGNREAAVKTLKLSAMNGKDATAAAKNHPKLKGMKIISVNVDPKFWDKLDREKQAKAKLKDKASKAPKKSKPAAAPAQPKRKTAKA